MTNTKKIIFAVILLGAIGGLVGFNMMRLNQTQEVGGIPRNAPPVHWSYPDVQTIVSSVSARGNVELRDRTILFPNTQAQITAVHVSVGDVVDVGDLLISYDDAILDTLNDQLAEAQLALRTAELGLAATQIAPLATEILAAENQIEQSRTNIANIQAQLSQIDLQISQMEDSIETAQENVADVQVLFDNDVVARLELDNATEAVRRLEDQLAVIVAQRDAAEIGLPMAQEAERLAIAQLENIRTRNTQPQALNQVQIQQVSIERAQLAIAQIERTISEFEREERAEVAGTVLNVFVETGEFSVTGRPLLEIADISDENLVIVVHVPENDAGNLELGQEVEISGNAIGNHRYDGLIELIHPIAAPRQMGTTVETVVTVEIAVAGSTRLRAGNTVDADITTNISEDAVVVPIMSTVGAGGGITFVYVLNDESYLERRDVVLGGLAGMYMEAEGVEAHERIVANPTAALHEGLLVRPIPALY